MTSLVSSVQFQHSALSSLQDPLPAMFAASTISTLHTYNMNITHLQYYYKVQYEHYKLKLAGFSSLRCSPASTSSTGPTISPWQTSSPSSSRYLIQQGLVNIHSSIHIKLYHQYYIEYLVYLVFSHICQLSIKSNRWLLN